MAECYNTVVLLGAPGAGKGTQGSFLGRLPGFFHFSTGDMFRSLDPESELGRVFADHSARGELVPDDVTVEIWGRYIRAQTILNIYKPHRHLLVLDGIPRNPRQTDLMDEHINVLGVIHLVCHDLDSMIDRLRGRAAKQGRADDIREDVIRRRFEVYEDETAPVLEHYESTIIHEIDAIGTPIAVLQQMLGVIGPIHDEHFADVMV